LDDGKCSGQGWYLRPSLRLCALASDPIGRGLPTRPPESLFFFGAPGTGHRALGLKGEGEGVPPSRANNHLKVGGRAERGQEAAPGGFGPEYELYPS
jgi:hypothetical protein